MLYYPDAPFIVNFCVLPFLSSILLVFVSVIFNFLSVQFMLIEFYLWNTLFCSPIWFAFPGTGYFLILTCIFACFYAFECTCTLCIKAVSFLWCVFSHIFIHQYMLSIFFFAYLPPPISLFSLIYSTYAIL